MKKFTINEFRAAYPDDDACLDKIFQLRYNGLVCPKCEGTKPFTRVKDRRSYQCPGCGFQIYPTQGTIFEKTTTPLTHWFYAIYLQTTTRNGVAAKELERQLDICYKTALRMAHQIKKLMSANVKEPFTGVVSMDETFVGGLNKNRHADKKTRQGQGRSSKDKTPVFVMINLSGKVKAFVVNNTSGEILIPIIEGNVIKEKCILVTDEHMGYQPLDKQQYMHVTVCHGMGEYARGAFHANTPESFNACLKRTIKGTHIHVSVKHLQKYVDEVAFRWMHSREQDTMFETILRRVV
jgi:transposase